MTKRSPAKPTPEDNQTDLFGGAPAPAPAPALKKARAPKTTLPLSAPTRPSQSIAPSSVPDALLNVRQAAVRLGLSKSTLDKMRCAGKGPRFVKTTDRAVRYDPHDLDAWIARRRSHGAPEEA